MGTPALPRSRVAGLSAGCLPKEKCALPLCFPKGILAEKAELVNHVVLTLTPGPSPPNRCCLQRLRETGETAQSDVISSSKHPGYQEGDFETEDILSFYPYYAFPLSRFLCITGFKIWESQSLLPEKASPLAPSSPRGGPQGPSPGGTELGRHRLSLLYDSAICWSRPGDLLFQFYPPSPRETHSSPLLARRVDFRTGWRRQHF